MTKRASNPDTFDIPGGSFEGRVLDPKSHHYLDPASSAALQGSRSDIASASEIARDTLPIVVDLDNILILSNSLHEQLAIALFKKPLFLLRTTLELFRRPSAFKAALSNELDLTLVSFPFREELLKWLQLEAAAGREIHLCSDANQLVVEAVAQRVGIFTTAIGSRTDQFKGQAKAAYLMERFRGGFVYVGNNRADLAVLGAAHAIVLVDMPGVLVRAVQDLGKHIEAEFRRRPFTILDILAALRAHHWLKNVLIFVPFILGHSWIESYATMNIAFGFLCLLMVTSASYLINDISDLEADRQHWSKRNRALASGHLSISACLLIVGLMLTVALASALVLSIHFAIVLTFYLVLTLCYSLGLKCIPILDTMIIGILFTSRLVMGITLLHQPFSQWLLTFSMFFFFSLALAKRYTELVHSGASAKLTLLRRGYQREDGPLALVLGVSCSVASLVIMVLFFVQDVQEPNHYHHPKVLVAIPLLLFFWVSRIWLLAHRGQMNDDPVTFALGDKVSLLLGTAIGTIFVMSL
jgi:4-hydroxybenzoate polyprenyltransferase